MSSHTCCDTTPPVLGSTTCRRSVFYSLFARFLKNTKRTGVYVFLASSSENTKKILPATSTAGDLGATPKGSGVVVVGAAAYWKTESCLCVCAHEGKRERRLALVLPLFLWRQQKRHKTHPRTSHGFFAVTLFPVRCNSNKTKRSFLTPTRSQPQLGLAVGCGGVAL